MALGDVLLKRISELKNTTKYGKNAFWIKLRDIAVDEINALYPSSVDSDIIIPIYWDILASNEPLLPTFTLKILKSNNQASYRVCIRNLFSSNAFHPDGLANQKHIIAIQEINENRRGYRTIYKGDGIYANSK